MTKKLTFLIAAAVMLLTMMATTGTAFADNASYVFNTDAGIAALGITKPDAGAGTALSTTTPYVVGQISMTATHGSTNTRVWNSNGTLDLRIYKSGGTLTFASASGYKITGITITGSTTNVFSVIVGSYSNGSWSNSTTGATSVTFTATGTGKINTITVTYESTGGGTTPSITANNVNIAYDATEGSIAYTVNNPVTGGEMSSSPVSGGDWLTVGGPNNGSVPLSCDENTSATARTATVRLTYSYGTSKETVTKDVTVTQAGNPNIVNNISDITAAGNYTVKGTIVAKSTRGFVLGDGTGYVYYYYGNNFSTTYTIGDIVKLSGAVTASDSYKVFQFTSSATITAATESNYVAEDPTVISGADMDAQVASTAAVSLSNYIQYQGTLTVNNTYYNITSIDGATTAKGSISYPTNTDFTSLNGKVVTVTGYYVGISSNTYYNTMIGSIEEVITSVATPTFSPVAGAYTGTQSVTISCETEGSTIYYTTDGTTPTNESTQYTAAIQVSETTTIKAIAYVGSSASTVATATYTITQPLNTIEAIFAAATSTETSVIVTFNNWVVSGVSTNGKNVYVTDGTNGLIIYYSSDMSDTFSAGNILSGENVSCKLKLYNGAAELINVDEDDLTITTGGTVTPANIEMADLSGVNTGALLHYDGLTCTVNNNKYYLTDGTTSLQLYNALFAFSNPEAGKVYNITGVYVQYNTTKEIMPRSVADIVEVAVPSITLTPSVINEAPAAGGSGEITVTCTNMGENPVLSIEFCDANGDPAEYDWISAEFNNTYTKITGTFAENTTTEPRTAHLRVYGTVSNSKTTVYSDIFSITQLAPAEPSIVFTTTTYNPGANGESKTISFNYEGLGDSPEFTVRFYDSTGETQTYYEWVSGEITQGDKVTITVEANDGEARTAYFKVYGEKNENVHAESNLVTITQAAYVVDYATLPFGYGGGVLSDFSSLNGTSYSLNDNGSYNETHAPYRIKFTKTGDYLQVKTNERPGIVTIGVKMVGGGTTSTITVQGSADGETFTNIQTLEISGSQNDIVNLATTNSFAATDRYVRLYFTKGSNVGVGPITIAQVDNTPSITAEDVNIAYDATEGSIAYTINNPVAGGNFQAIPQTGGDRFIIGEIGENTIPFTCPVNTESNEQTATIELTYTYNRATVSKVVTITQAAAPATMYVVNFILDDGTFVPNDDFPQDVVEKEAGTYTLPSATKAGYDFTGWDDGDQIYAAGDEYTVSADVDFTAQWTESTTGTIVFGTNNVKINATEVSGDDSMGNTWTITTEGTSSFTQNAAYSQVGSGSSPATSITFTMTLPQQKIISAFEAKFGGFNGTVGDIALTVGNTTVGSGSLNGSTDVIVEATTTTEVGTVLTVTVTNIDKGVKCYYISYTLSDAPVVPVIDATAGSALAYNATAGSIIYEIANYEVGTMTATTTADWINALVVTTPTAEDGEVTFNVTENTSNESRSATVTLSFTYGNPAATVTKDVTVTQNGTPSITVTPATANVAFAGGAPDFAVTYESLEITKADDFDVEFYETSTSTIAGNQPSWITNVAITGNTTDGFTLTTTVAANDGAARNAYLKVYALDENTEPVYSGLVTISQAEHTQLATYSLVTSVDDIVSGKHYIIASSATDGDAYAMGGQTSNNRSGVAVTIDNSQITETEDVYEFVINTHETSSKDVVYTIYDAATPGYLYAASSSKNYLRTKTTLDDNGKWTIAIAAEGSAASIVAQGSNTRNNMKFNSSDVIFSCYASGQSPIYLYVKDNDVNLEYYGGEVAYPGNSIPAGGSITVGAGSVLTVPTGFTNTDPNAFIIQDGGQVIYNGNGTFNATLQNNITAYSNEPGVSDGWYLIASPVDNLPTSAVGTGTYDLFAYDEATAYWWSNTGDHPFYTLTRGQGYLYANSANQLLAYAGTMGATNENIEKQLSYTSTLGDDVRGFNLIGNPFTRNLGAGDMTIDETTLTQCYVVNAATTGLTSIDIASYQIKPGEGFFVQAIAENQTLEFNPTSKGLEDIKFIKIVAGNENGTDNAYINIGCGNTLRKMNIADLTNVYVMNEDKDFAAARIEELAGTMPVNFEAVEDGEYTITVEAKFIEAHSMHLIDNFTGADIDLMVEPSYTFNATANDNAERFTLVFDFNNYTGCNENNTSENFIYQNGDEIIVNGEGELQVFDVLGRFVMSQNVSGVERISKPAQTGVYIFMMNGNAQKIVVK